MDKGKLANLVKETEKGLFRANKQLRSVEAVALEIERLLQNLVVAEQAAERRAELAKDLRKQILESRVVGQSRQLFNQLEKLRLGLDQLAELQERVRPFVERHRTGRVYAFKDSGAAAKFARQLMELFSVQNALFKPRFIGTVDLGETALALKLRKSDGGLLLQPRDLRAFVKYMSLKRLASNISLEAEGMKLVWQDKKTIAVDALPEKLYRMDRLCDVLEGSCLEK